MPRTVVARLTAIAVLGAALLVTGCGDSLPTAPAPATPSRDLLSSVLGTLTGSTSDVVNLPAVERITALPSDISVTKTIGASGGNIAVPAAGLTVRFPSGAVAQPTVITVTAYAGKYVAYGFAPHGITFASPVSVTQSLQGTNARYTLLQSPVVGGYLANGQSDIAANGVATITELRPVQLLFSIIDGLLGLDARFTINHFSGYILASGRSGSAE